jgi:DNA-binding NtrC family response regulator
MNLLFIHHDQEIRSEISDLLGNNTNNCYFSRNTIETIRILDDHPIDLVVMIVNHMRVAAVLKYINDNYKDLEVLLMAGEEFDEIISLFSDGQYRTVRLPGNFSDLRPTIQNLFTKNSGERTHDRVPEFYSTN